MIGKLWGRQYRFQALIATAFLAAAPFYVHANLYIEPPEIPSKPVYDKVSLTCSNFLSNNSSEQPSGNFKKSPEQFQREVKNAQEEYPGVFENLAIEPLVYRIDRRSPHEMRRAQGFWPNPEKPEGYIESHTLKNSPGGGSYVSFSWQHNEEGILRNAFFLDNTPSFTISGDKVQMIATKSEWEKMRAIEYPIDSNGETPGNPPELMGWIMYEYRISHVLGTRILGGHHTREKELIARGVRFSEHTLVEYRRVVLTAMVLTNLIGSLNSDQYHRRISGGDKVRTQIEYGEWSPL